MAQTVDTKKKRCTRGSEAVRRVARVSSRVAELHVSDPQSSVHRPMSHPAVVDAVSCLPPVDQRRRTADERTR